ncbi:uncharacterized protein LOC132628700 [Lycium barbarum]|uniref:uncharacterized protein LOC132628700 n=1 Tax=Lycium barbarum TaxID=112863 RepID=UPI00293E603D|nr:uncharacterized protein LOC132628700 [Lycium barbarum]
MWIPYEWIRTSKEDSTSWILLDEYGERLLQICAKMTPMLEERTLTGATPYLLVYGTEVVIPAEVEIPSLRIIQEAELDNADWVRARYEQLALIDEKWMIVVCHGQLYRQRMARAFNKRARTRLFQIRQLVLKRIFPHQEEYKGKFAPNWQRPYIIRKVLSDGAVVLAEMDGQEWPKPINFDAIKRYYA